MNKLGKSISRENVKKIKEACKKSGCFEEIKYKILNCTGYVFKSQPDILLFIDGSMFFWAKDIKGKDAKLFLKTPEIIEHLNNENKNVIYYNLDLFT